MYIILNFLKDKSACWPNPCDGRTRCVTAAYNNQPLCLRYGKFDERGEDINFIYKNLVNTATFFFVICSDIEIVSEDLYNLLLS